MLNVHEKEYVIFSSEEQEIALKYGETDNECQVFCFFLLLLLQIVIFYVTFLLFKSFFHLDVLCLQTSAQVILFSSTC